MMLRNLPTFLVIGAARSGTSALYAYLRQHPDIYMSPVKEPNFFAAEGEPIPYEGSAESILEWVTSPCEYADLFRCVSTETALGEASGLYLYSPKAPERIKAYVPNIRLVAILRNPIDRAYSAFCYLRERGREPHSNFIDALAAEDERVAADWSHIWHYRRMGFYYEQLRRYYECFGGEQICVVVYDDFSADPRGVTQAIYGHLGVDRSFEPDTRLRPNVSGQPRFRPLSLLTTSNPVTDRVRPLLGKALGPMIWRVKPRLVSKPPVPVESARMLSKIFRNDVEELSALLGRDLTSWLRVADNGQHGPTQSSR